MFGAQMAVSGLILIGYGVWMARQVRSLVARARARSRGQRIVGGVGLLVGAVAVLFGGLAGLMALGAFGGGALAPLPWGAVTLLGLAFVHGQTVGALHLFAASLPEPDVTKPAGDTLNLAAVSPTGDTETTP